MARLSLPTWLPLRTAIIGGLSLFLAIALAVAWHNRDQRLRREAIAEERIRVLEGERKKQDSVIVVRTTELRIAQARTDTVVRTVTHTVTKYEMIRNTIDTTAIAQPPGTPGGYVSVPIAFVEAADSMARVLPLLTRSLSEERLAAAGRILAGDSARAILAAENAQLRIAAQLGKSNWGDRLKWTAIGMAIGFAGDRLLTR